MPNWCFNKITIRAGKETRDNIANFLKGDQYFRPWNYEEGKQHDVLVAQPTLFAFHNVIPQPDYILEETDPRRKTNVPKDSEDGWYNWRVNNWGTKWEVSEVAMYESKVALTYEFDTAWSPPEPVIAKLSELFPNAYITLFFDEPGMAFRGSISYKEGGVVRETGCPI